MRPIQLQYVPILPLTCAMALAAGCSVELSDNEPAASIASETPQPMPTPVYVSNLSVSTNCGVESFPEPPPGFAETVGTARRDMPERIAKNMAIGADRPLAETDSSRVSPGYVVIDPGGVRESFIINNEKEVVATFSRRLSRAVLADLAEWQPAH